jgi:hypothetical protein
MLRRHKTFTRSMLLALMLVLGSVQAHATYFCSMMDTVIHDDCCCADADIDDMVFMDGEPCCEKSVELGVDTTSDQAQSSIKPIKFESDVDPPVTIASAVELSPKFPDIASLYAANYDAVFYTSGSATYLITRRLRL